MKRMLVIVGLLLMVLTACGGGDGVYASAYTASGDGTNELELNRTKNLRQNDDFNVVIKLNSHDSDVEVTATFFRPDGTQEGDALTAIAGENVGTVVIGLDWDTRPVDDEGEIPLWTEGTWEVVIEVDGEEVDRLSFTV